MEVEVEVAGDAGKAPCHGLPLPASLRHLVGAEANVSLSQAPSPLVSVVQVSFLIGMSLNIEPQLGGFGIELATWLGVMGSAGLVVGASCCDFSAFAEA